MPGPVGVPIAPASATSKPAGPVSTRKQSSNPLKSFDAISLCVFEYGPLDGREPDALLAPSIPVRLRILGSTTDWSTPRFYETQRSTHGLPRIAGKKARSHARIFGTVIEPSRHWPVIGINAEKTGELAGALEATSPHAPRLRSSVTVSI